ncbi:exopolyphosphatase PRUNE1 [Prorops nasuta]|uniref:exopolyphosphatase PRUNE1 n=1 Tax=Prorops nasuta TaxID=863751 RepID=UPI0034CD17B6
MCKMEKFLKASKEALGDLGKCRKVRVVMGNQTCDLDSAVCALAKGLAEYREQQKKNRKEVATIPLMNIPQKEFRVKTEVVYYLQRHGLHENLLTFRDQIDLGRVSSEGKLELILVDHHVLVDEDELLASSVVEIIDHRPQDDQWPWEGRTIHLQTVGSCATLVAFHLLRNQPEILDTQLCSLLRGPILADTYNLSKKVDRATPLDYEMIEKLEKLGNLKAVDRDETYKDILNAKTDISCLTTYDLLIRDLKETNGVPIAVFPMLVEEFLGMDDWSSSLRNFTKEKNAQLVILIGLELRNDRVTRDIAVFSLSSNELENKVIQALTSSSQPSLDLTLTKQIKEEDPEGGYSLSCFQQRNLSATRKQILPIVRAVTAEFCQCQKFDKASMQSSKDE